METNWHEWTSCEFYGHVFQTDEETGRTHCTDCGEKTEDHE